MLNNNRLISVVMPAFNSAAFISTAIESVLLQTHKNWELLIVDDGSTDQTAEIVRSFHDARIRYIQSDHSGIAGARNRGIRAAKGDMIAFLDSDDEWRVDKLESQIKRLIEDDALLVYSDAEIFGDFFPVKKYSELMLSMPEGNVVRELLVENFIVTSSVLAKKEKILETGGFSEDPRIQVGEDYLLWLNLARTGRFASVREPLTRYRIHGRQTTGKKMRSARSIRYIFSLLRKDPAFASYRSQIDKIYFKKTNRYFAALLLDTVGVLSVVDLLRLKLKSLRMKRG